MEKGKNCYRKNIETVEGGFKIRVCEKEDGKDKKVTSQAEEKETKT